MTQSPLVLHPVSVPEWEAEDLLIGTLAPPVTLADDATAKAMLEEIVLKLPAEILHDELNVPLSGDARDHDFYAVQVPLNILVPEGLRISRLRLSLRLLTNNRTGTDAVAYDLFPSDQWEVKEISPAEVKLDVSKALSFTCPAIGDCFGLKLEFPIKWKTEAVRIRTSDRMSNPVEWYVTDRSVEHGFAGATIVRTRKGTDLQVDATIVGELRKSGPIGWISARFRTDSKTYPVRRGRR